jgi:hypothetical protein
MPIFVRASKLQADCKVWRSSSSDANANEAWNEVRALEIVDSGDACAVCLEEPMEDPLQLPCGHAFCRLCINDWRMHSDRERIKKNLSKMKSVVELDSVLSSGRTQSLELLLLTVYFCWSGSSSCPTCRLSLPPSAQSLVEHANLLIIRADHAKHLPQQIINSMYAKAQAQYEQALTQDPKDLIACQHYQEFLGKTASSKKDKGIV